MRTLDIRALGVMQQNLEFKRRTRFRGFRRALKQISKISHPELVKLHLTSVSVHFCRQIKSLINLLVLLYNRSHLYIENALSLKPTFFALEVRWSNNSIIIIIKAGRSIHSERWRFYSELSHDARPASLHGFDFIVST